MFESLKDSEALQRRMLTEVLYQCQQHLGVRVVSSASADQAGPSLRVCLYLPQALASYVAAVATMSAMAPGATARALIWLYASTKPTACADAFPTTHGNPLVEVIAMMGNREIRTEQISAFNAIEDALYAGKIGVVEASTGVGKTLAAVLAANRWAQQQNQSCCIATPTLALMHQFIAEYRKLAAVMPVVELRAFFGRREFVSQQSIMSMLNAEPLRWPKVHQWATSGAISAHPDDLEPRWLKATLHAIDSEFPFGEVLLSDIADGEDAGYQSYKRQFEVEQDASLILLCTHAMLAQDMRLKLRAARRDEEFSLVNAGIMELVSKFKDLAGLEKVVVQDQITEAKRQLGEVMATAEGIVGVLPRYRALIVDEAHTLEANFSAALSDYLALRKVAHLLVNYKRLGGKVSAAALAEVNDALASIQQGAGAAAEFTPLNATQFSDVREALERLSTVLSPLAEVKVRSLNAEKALILAELRRSSNLVKLALNRASARTYLRLSPHRSYPQLYIGRDNVENVLKMMWDSVKAGIALSATLYLYRSTGPHAGYISGILGIPDAKRADYVPIEASWLADCIEQVDVVRGPRAKSLRPPSRRDALNEDQRAEATSAWLDGVAQELIKIHCTSTGGVLVLNTSYAYAKGLSERLSKSMREPVVCADEGKGVALQARSFLEHSDAGRKPIWLAVGGAWTGLDIGGHEPRQALLGKDPIPAADDVVLTDLVIPRLPFGTNNSITHLRRILSKPSIPWDLLDAGFRFRQALGRLVRRQGLPPNRRIWILDGRLDDPESKSTLAVFWAPLLRLRERIEARQSL